MNINVSIIDQQVRALAEVQGPRFADELNIKNDEQKARSAAFVLLTLKTLLDLSAEETFDCLTEGGNDFGVDAIHLSDVVDGEFTATLVQSKYKQKLEGTSNFEETGVIKSIQAIKYLFNPSAVMTVNKRLEVRVEEIRALIREGNLPRVRFILCNNGLKWTSQAQQLIDHERFPERVHFEHVNQDILIGLMQAAKPVQDTVRLSGKAIVEDFNFIRVMVGKVPVTEIAELLRRHGDRLLERNIRRFLGLVGNRVNEGIRQTLNDPAQRSSFYFYNNGLTLTCKKFDYNALQGDNYQVRVEGLQIINGGQTCKTIEATLAGLVGEQQDLDKAFVLVRLYQLPAEGPDLVRQITYATNSQNPVDLRDLRSNDQMQRQLELSIAELGYAYRRQRSDTPIKSTDITTATAAEAVLSVWRRRPHQAKFLSREHFGKLYDLIFSSDLNGAQIVIATLLFRFAENRRKRPPEGSPVFVPYASCYIAMLMGRYLLEDLKAKLEELDHRNFTAAKALIETKLEAYYAKALPAIHDALVALYNEKEISLQRLSATFRREDLIEFLNVGPQSPGLLGPNPELSLSDAPPPGQS
jgi:hypothetical protein